MAIVKRYKAYIPVGIRDWEQETIKVHLDPKSGMFGIDLPKNIYSVIRSILDPKSNIRIQDVYHRPKATRDNPVPNQELIGRQVLASDLQTVCDLFTVICKRYSTWMQDNVAVKYLLIEFGYNVRHVDGFHNAPDAPLQRQGAFANYAGGPHARMSFATVPAVELSYKVVWMIENKLYNKSRTDTWHAIDSRDVSKKHSMRWTQEREDFLAKMDHGLTTMICRMIEFFEDLEDNMTTAIDSGSSVLALGKSPTAKDG